MEKCSEIPKLYVDNASTVKLMKDPEFQKRSKHNEVCYYFVHERYQDGWIGVEHIDGLKQLRIETLYGVACIDRVVLDTTTCSYCYCSIIHVLQYIHI